jgi:flagellar hook-basal body complex protein FliE
MVSAIQVMRSGPSGLVEDTGLSSNLSAGKENTKHVSGSGFGDLLRSTIGEVGQLEQEARMAADGLMRGTGVDVHQALIAAEKANAAFELALAMRNKAIQSYQSVMGMQF